MSEPFEKRRSLGRRFRSSPLAVLSASFLMLAAGGAIFAPWIAPQNPYDLATLDLSDAFKPPLGSPGGQWPFLLGTDNQGRDILSTILYGLRISFLVGLGVVLSAGSVGISLGLWAGFRGGWLEALLMRFAEVVFAFSTTLMAILIMGLLKARGVGAVILAIAITDWVRYARTARGSTLWIKSEEYVIAAQALGLSTFRILARHVLPNILPPLLVIAAVDFAVVIVLEATLSFLGIGVPITQPSLGMMISIGSKYLYAGHWWMIVFPGIVLILLTMSMNLLGDWLRDELDPHRRSQA